MAPRARKHAISTQKRAPSKTAATTKRKRTADSSPRPVKRQNRGTLQHMLDLPVDVLQEIFSNLHPLALLQVSRVNKTFKSMIIHNGSSMWIASFNGAGLDWSGPLRASMSGPLLAALLFELYCRGCARTRVVTPILMLKTRLCANCIYKSDEYSTSLPVEDSQFDYEKTRMRLKQIRYIMPSDWPIHGSFNRNSWAAANSRPYYPISTFRRFWQETKDLPDLEFGAWCKEREKEVANQVDLCFDLYEYLKMKQDAHNAELDKHRRDRVKSIVARLCREKVIYKDPLTRGLVTARLASAPCAGVWCTAPLTREDWERAIRRTVIHELWDRLRQCILIPADDPEFGLDKLLNVQ